MPPRQLDQQPYVRVCAVETLHPPALEKLAGRFLHSINSQHLGSTVDGCYRVPHSLSSGNIAA